LLAEKLSQSTALAPLPARDAVVYRSLDIPTSIHEALTSNGTKSAPIDLTNIILDYLLPVELKRDLQNSLVVPPESADALSRVSYGKNTALVKFNAPFNEREEVMGSSTNLV